MHTPVIRPSIGVIIAIGAILFAFDRIATGGLGWMAQDLTGAINFAVAVFVAATFISAN
jgi:hypothetical protein